MKAGLEACAGEGWKDVVTLISRDPLLQSPHPCLGCDLSYDPRHPSPSDIWYLSFKFNFISSTRRTIFHARWLTRYGDGILLWYYWGSDRSPTTFSNIKIDKVTLYHHHHPSPPKSYWAHIALRRYSTIQFIYILTLTYVRNWDILIINFIYSVYDSFLSGLIQFKQLKQFQPTLKHSVWRRANKVHTKMNIYFNILHKSRRKMVRF